MTDAGKFHELFERWAVRIRARITFRRALTGAAIGLVVGALAATAAWQARLASLRPWMVAAGAVGLLAGAGFALRRRWSDTEVALYLDGKLHTDETITTAVELRNRAEEDDIARVVVVRQAAEALTKGDPKSARPTLFTPFHLLIPLAAAAIAVVVRLPVPVLAQPPAPPGAELVRVADIEGLEKVIALAELQTPDDAQRERLRKIAEEAKKLREKLREGIEQREAQSEIAKLRDAIAAERLQFGEGERRAGLEAAHGRLAQDKMLKDAARALGDRDLTRFDEEMQKLANKLEQQDREAAKRALEEAAEAARREGADDVAKMLEEQKKLFEERSERGQALREFAEAFGDDLPEDARDALEEFDSNGLDESAGDLSKRLAEALGNLTPEERKRLAERLKARMGDGALDPMAKEQMRDMAEKLNTPEGQKELEDMLRKMANDPPDSEDAERDRALGEAERGLGGVVPVPTPGSGGANGPGDKPGGAGGADKSGDGNGPGSGSGSADSAGKSGGSNQDGSGKGGPGSHHDTGRGDHAGHTAPVDGDGFRSRAGGKINPGAPMPGVVTGRGKGRAGESANVRGLGGIGEAAPGELGGAERSEIPEEYREQVGRYFSP